MKKTTEKRSTVSWKETLSKYSKWTMLALLAVAVLFPVVIQNSYYRGIGTKIVMYMLLASSVNVINGYSGQFSIGHAGFMCVGAYTSAILMTRAGWNFLPAVLTAGVITALFGMLVSIPISKLSGIYLGFVTLGFSEIVRITCLNWTSVTGGPMGIKAIPGPSFFGISLSTPQGYYLSLIHISRPSSTTIRRSKPPISRWNGWPGNGF